MAGISSAEFEKIVILGNEIVVYIENMINLNNHFLASLAFGEFERLPSQIDQIATSVDALGGRNPHEVQGHLKNLIEKNVGINKCTAQIDSMASPYNVLVSLAERGKKRIVLLKVKIREELQRIQRVETDIEGMAAAFAELDRDEFASAAHLASGKISRFMRREKRYERYRIREGKRLINDTEEVVKKLEEIQKRLLEDVLAKVLNNGDRFHIAYRDENLTAKLFAMMNEGKAQEAYEILKLYWREGLKASDPKVREAAAQCEADREAVEQIIAEIGKEAKHFKGEFSAEFIKIKDIMAPALK